MVSIAVSAWTAKARDAVIRAYLAFFCLLVLPVPVLGLLSSFPEFAWTAPVLEQFVIANPVVTFVSTVTGFGPWGAVSEPWSLLLALVRNQMLTGGIAVVLAHV